MLKPSQSRSHAAREMLGHIPDGKTQVSKGVPETQAKQTLKVAAPAALSHQIHEVKIRKRL